MKLLSLALIQIIFTTAPAFAYPSDRCATYGAILDCWIRCTEDGSLSSEFAKLLGEALETGAVKELKINLSNGGPNDARPAGTGWLSGEKLADFLSRQAGAASVQKLKFLLTGPVLGGKFTFALPALREISVQSQLGDWYREKEGTEKESQRNRCAMPKRKVPALQLDFRSAPELSLVTVEGCLPYPVPAVGGDILLPKFLREFRLDGAAAYDTALTTRPLLVKGAESTVGRLFIAPALLNSANYIRKFYYAPFAANYLRAEEIRADELVVTSLPAPAATFFAGLPRGRQVWIAASNRQEDAGSLGFKMGEGLGDHARYFRAQPMPIELSPATLGAQVESIDAAGPDSVFFSVSGLEKLKRASVVGLSRANDLPALVGLEFAQSASRMAKLYLGKEEEKSTILANLPALAELTLLGEDLGTVDLTRAPRLTKISAIEAVRNLSLREVDSLDSLAVNAIYSLTVEHAANLRRLALDWRPLGIINRNDPHRGRLSRLTIRDVPSLQSLALAYRLQDPQRGTVTGDFVMPSVATTEPDALAGWIPLLETTHERAIVEAPNVTELFLHGEAVTYRPATLPEIRKVGQLFPKLQKIELAAGADHFLDEAFLAGLPASVRDLKLLPTWLRKVCDGWYECENDPDYLERKDLKTLDGKLTLQLGAQGFTPAAPPAPGRLRFVR